MKYVVIVAVVLIVLWLLRPRRRVGDGAAPRPQAQVSTEPMVTCSQCGIHLPRSDALPGRGGVFCGEAHRAAHEAAHRE